MEDLDPPREQAGAAHCILHSLQAHGLKWDGPVVWQSERDTAYDAAIDSLLQRQLAFYCDCSRQQLAASGGVYQGRCRERALAPAADLAIRVRLLETALIKIPDSLQSPLQQDLKLEVGDFIIRRRDQLTAYQLAVVVDDAWQGITHVLRGSDLYDSTPRQVYLQQLLGLPTPHYTHIPVLTNREGQKLSKQTHAVPIEDNQAAQNLRDALDFLCQAKPPDHLSKPAPLLEWALAHWQPGNIPPRMAIPETPDP